MVSCANQSKNLESYLTSIVSPSSTVSESAAGFSVSSFSGFSLSVKSFWVLLIILASSSLVNLS